MVFHDGKCALGPDAEMTPRFVRPLGFDRFVPLEEPQLGNDVYRGGVFGLAHGADPRFVARV